MLRPNLVEDNCEEECLTEKKIDDSLKQPIVDDSDTLKTLKFAGISIPKAPPEADSEVSMSKSRWNICPQVAMQKQKVTRMQRSRLLRVYWRCAQQYGRPVCRSVSVDATASADGRIGEIRRL